MHLLNIEMLYLLWLALPLIGAFVFAAIRRRKAMGKFVDAGLLGKVITPASAGRRATKAGMMLFAIAFIVVALTRPGWNPSSKTIERRGRDVVFVLDVSRSMQAADLVPNRLWHAKQAISDCIDRIQGDRVALVVFAGASVVKCPLTMDYGFFRMMLEDAAPDSVGRGGTAIGDAIRKTLEEVFDDQVRECKDIILITDGEDHDSFPEDAAKLAGERGIRLIIIGLGDEGEGKRVPITDEAGRKTFLSYNGREVWSKLDAGVLRRMADATPGGKYLNVATAAINLGEVYVQLVAGAAKKELESATIEQYEEKFQIFLACGFALLCMEMLMGERRRKA